MSALLWLGACSYLPASLQVGRPQNSPPAPVVAAPRSDVERLLAFSDTLQGASREFLDGEVVRLKARAAQANDPMTKMQLAILLGLPGHPFSDTGRAATLCGEVARDSTGPSPMLRSLAVYLQTLLAQQAKQEDNLQSLTQRVRDEQRRADSVATAAGQQRADDAASSAAQGQQGLAQRLKDEQKRTEALQAKHDEAIAQLNQKLKDEQRKSESLQQKLDALTSIEKNLIERQKVKP